MTDGKLHVYEAIGQITAAFAKDGIGKDRTNKEQNYKFRGIDDVYNALAPLLAANGLVILPKYISRDVSERLSSKGNKMFNIVLKVEFTFKSTKDGSEHIVSFFGEATDSADKATNKASSAAYKYCVIQTFCIPVEGEDDADKNTPEETRPEPKQTNPARPAASFWNTTEEQKKWKSATDDQIREWSKLSSDRRKGWLEKALKHLPTLKAPEDIARWKTANIRFIDQLGPKQKEHLLQFHAKALQAVAQAPLKSSGEEPNYDQATGEVIDDDSIPGDFGPGQE